MLINGLQQKPRISNAYALAINNFAQSLQPDSKDQPHNALTHQYQAILQALYNNATRNDWQGTGVDLQ